MIFDAKKMHKKQRDLIGAKHENKKHVEIIF